MKQIGTMCACWHFAFPLDTVELPQLSTALLSPGHKTRDSFSSRDEYARFVKNNIAVGQMVRCCESYERVSLGDIGKVTKVIIMSSMRCAIVQQANR